MVLRAWAADHRAPIPAVSAALARAAADPAALTDADAVTLLGADGDHLDRLCALADAARRERIGADTLTFVVNRNLDTGVVTALPATGDVSVADLVREAVAAGATEICLQGPLPADAPADGYLRVVDQIAAAAEVHLHAFRAPEIADAAARMGIGIAEFLTRARAAGLGSVPGTAAQILDDEVRAALAPGGAAPPVGAWVDVITAAHAAGLFSTATMVYGHVETPAHQVAHLRLLTRIQQRTQGFSELILMPMVASNTPPHLRGRPTVSVRETRAVHAVARLLTLGHLDHLQVAWTKFDAATVDALLTGGVDDIGGLLLDGTLLPDAGAEAGRVLDPATLLGFADRAGRTLVQRTTSYARPPADRLLPLDRVPG
ncbi:MAG: FO synthase [Gordonia sp. (in: high G+C Gram-positive bacteria)]